MLAFRKHFTRQAVHLGSQQVNSPHRMHEGTQFFTAHFHPDELRTLRTGSQKSIEVVIAAQRDPFVHPQHIGDLPFGFGADRENAGRTQLPCAAPQRPDILPVLRPVDPDLKITQIFRDHSSFSGPNSP